MSLNSLPVTYLQLQVELMYFLRMRKTLLSCLKHTALDRLRVQVERCLVYYKFNVSQHG